MNNSDPSDSGSFLAVSRSGDLPDMLIAVTRAESDHPHYKNLRAHIQVGPDGRIPSSNPFALAFVAVLRVERILLVRYPKFELGHRICRGLRRILGQALWLTRGRASIPEDVSATKRRRV